MEGPQVERVSLRFTHGLSKARDLQRTGEGNFVPNKVIGADPTPVADIDESLPPLRYGVTEYTEEETVRATHEPLARYLQGKLGH